MQSNVALPLYRNQSIVEKAAAHHIDLDFFAVHISGVSQEEVREAIQEARAPPSSVVYSALPSASDSTGLKHPTVNGTPSVMW